RTAPATARRKRHPSLSVASRARAPACDQAAWIQVVPRARRGAAGAWSGGRRRPERLGEVERRRRAALGVRQPEPERAAGGEARRRALRRLARRPRAGGFLRGRAPLRQRG